MGTKKEKKACQNCKQNFAIEPVDFKFYAKMDVPAPTFCPECRLVRRMVWRNDRSLYTRPCDRCKKDKIMMYDAKSPYVVYCRECWNADTWNGIDYGQEYDFSRPFFEQFRELLLKVPRPGNLQQGVNVNSEYTNRASNNKNCYLVFGSNFNEDCVYGQHMNDSKDSMDSYNLQKSELCYECIDCVGCYNLRYSQDCNQCSQSYFLNNCRNSDNCFGCSNLRGINYAIFNKQYSKDEYERIVGAWNLGDRSAIEKLWSKAKDESLKKIYPHITQNKSVNISGNWLESCKDTMHSFSCRNVEDARYALGIIDGKDVMDYSFYGRGCELVYDTVSVGYGCSNILFSNECWNDVLNSTYSMNCMGASDIFGCIGLRKKQYCILNKQYTKEEYKRLKNKIIKHMNNMPYKDAYGRTYTFGEFFPFDLSTFAYNETIAQEYFPLSAKAAAKAGYLWKNVAQKSQKTDEQARSLPSFIADVGEDITKQTIQCLHNDSPPPPAGGGECAQQCTIGFRIVPIELAFYQKMNIPLPQLCSNCRHYERLKKRNPLKLWARDCMCRGTELRSKLSAEGGVLRRQNYELREGYRNTVKHFHGEKPCLVSFETTYAPDRKEIVYDERCYISEVA